MHIETVIRSVSKIMAIINKPEALLFDRDSDVGKVVAHIAASFADMMEAEAVSLVTRDNEFNKNEFISICTDMVVVTLIGFGCYAKTYSIKRLTKTTDLFAFVGKWVSEKSKIDPFTDIDEDGKKVWQVYSQYARRIFLLLEATIDQERAQIYAVIL